MKRIALCFVGFIAALYFSEPAFAQHSPGVGGGFGKGSGSVFGGSSGRGMPSIPGGNGSGHSGSGAALPSNSQGKPATGDSGSTGGKTASDLLTQNTRLSSNLQGLLPNGTNLQDASSGFSNLGQFVAAVHVSHNLGIPFDQLKTKMMGGASLGQAIHELKPNVDAHQESLKANHQALEDIEKSMGSKQSAAANGREK